MSAQDRPRERGDLADVECGGYAADLALWRELADAADGPILDLGCGTGRVALDLARHGHRGDRGVDLDPELVAALNARAAAARAAVATATVGDARDFDLDQEFALVMAPMQLIQVLGGPAERVACLRCVAAAPAPGRPPRGRDRRRLPGRARPTSAASACPTRARSTAGSTPACRSDAGARRRARSSSAACARRSPPPASSSDELDEIPLRLLERRDGRGRGARGGARAGRPPPDRADRRPRRLDRRPARRRR